MSTHENIYTIPNILTFSRLVAAPMVGYFILNSNHVLALSFFAYAAITDLIDGYIARKYNQQTVVGTVIDPMADKILMTVGVVCLAMKSAIPESPNADLQIIILDVIVWLAAIILARDVGLGFAAIYYRWISLPPPKTMARYWDFSLPSAEVKPTGVSKVNTALQVLLLGSAMAAPVVPEVILSSWGLQEGLIGLQYLVALTTTWSGLQYVYLKDTNGVEFAQAAPFNLSPGDIEALGQTDEEFCPHTWQDLKNVLGRSFSLILTPDTDVKAKYGSVMDYICQERLGWVRRSEKMQNHEISKQEDSGGISLIAQTAEEESSFEFKNPIPFADPEDYTILRNDWPYGLNANIVHLVVWLKNRIPVDNEKGDPTTESKKLIEEFVYKTFTQKIFLSQSKGAKEDNIKVLADEKVLWFKNKKKWQSVGGIEHIHIMLQDVAESLVFEWTGQTAEDIIAQKFVLKEESRISDCV
ncbi:hypothetical protein FQN57_006396 [Myotisia sp. PD_48]|nr:hypothetical protein FQN57_006396 [Myotisia sp. PD_48]